MTISIIPLNAFEDNYIWVIHNDKYAIVVDPGEYKQVNQFLRDNHLTLSGILITHHHYDHINGVNALLSQWKCEVYAPKDDRLNFKSTVVVEGDLVEINELGISFKILFTPGHTKSHICYYNDDWLFCGDTLFSMGCGRMFEGTAEQFVNSLNKIKKLPAETEIFCTHEYTLSNISFALSIEAENNKILKLKNEVINLRKNQIPSIPTVLKDELKLNPFLRTHDQSFQKTVSKLTNTVISDDVSCFAQIRKMKDVF